MKRILVTLLLLLTLLPLPACGRAGKTVVVVKVSGEIVARLPLDQDTELKIDGKGGTNLLIIRDGRAWVESADCKNQICVQTGSIDEKSLLGMITCLPHEVVIFLERKG